MTTISLVRHGEVHNPERVYYGRLPRFRLSQFGRKQAADTARYLDGKQVDAVYCSPLLRARQTAAVIAERLDLPVRRSELLIEVLTPHDGRPIADLDKEDWDFYTGAPSPFEQPADIVARMSRFCQRVRRQYAGGHVVAVSHGDPITWAVLAAAGLRPTLANRRQLDRVGLPVPYPVYACVISLTFAPGADRPEDIAFFAPPQAP